MDHRAVASSDTFNARAPAQIPTNIYCADPDLCLLYLSRLCYCIEKVEHGVSSLCTNQYPGIIPSEH